MNSRKFLADLWERIRANVSHQPWVIHFLRAIACFAVYYVELGAFWPSRFHCRNTLGSEAAAAPIQILVLADPQIITTKPHPSYHGTWASITFPLASLFADRFLNRAWRALRSPGYGVQAWTATIWLGDLTDTGRDWRLDQHLYKLYNRFFRVLPEDRTSSWNRTYYIPGNHDTALKQHDGWRDQWEYQAIQTRDYSRWKFLSLFGTDVWDGGWDASPIYAPDALMRNFNSEHKQRSKYLTKLEHKSRRTFNARVPINAAHADGSPSSRVAEVILLDATDIVSLQRMHLSPWNVPRDGSPGRDSDWKHGGSWWFVDSLSKDRDPSIPRILFTHIPLYREPVQSREACILPDVATFPPGVMPAVNPSLTRQSKSSLQMGTDTEGTYENMIGKEWSRFILQKIQPNVIFSGDDHDHCHHLHAGITGVLGGQPWTIPELTVNALSLTSGVGTPGYARLSIWQEPSQPSMAPNGSSLAGTGAQTRISYVACALPRQIELWATVYPLLILLVSICLPLQRAWRIRRGGHDVSRGRTRGGGAAGTRDFKHGFDEREIEGAIWDAEEVLPLQPRRSLASPTSRPTDMQDAQQDDDDDDEEEEEEEEEAEGRARLQEEVEFLGAARGTSGGVGVRGKNGRSTSRRRSSSSFPSRIPLDGDGNGGRDGDGSSVISGRRRRVRSGLLLWLREVRDVAWIPSLYWLLLWLFGF